MDLRLRRTRRTSRTHTLIKPALELDSFERSVRSLGRQRDLTRSYVFCQSNVIHEQTLSSCNYRPVMLSRRLYTAGNLSEVFQRIPTAAYLAPPNG